MLKKSLFVIFLVLLMPLANAFVIESEDYKEVVCIGSTTVITDKITGEQVEYTLDASGNAYSFATIVPNKFTISGNSQNIYSYITPNSKISPGEYALNLIVKDNKGNTKEQSHKISVKDCHKSSLEVEKEKKSCPCENTPYIIILENLGDFEEEFSISVEGIPKEWIAVSKERISLKPSESTQINATISPPCNVYGQYKVKFNAISSSYAKISETSSLDILPCYEYELKLPNPIVLCENDQSEILVKLENKGTANNSLRLNLDGPEWMKLNEKEVIIMKGEEKILEINASPPMKIKGTFNVKLSALSSIGDVKKEALSKIEIKKCYESSIEVPIVNDNLCKREKKYLVKLNNKGEFKMRYNLKVDGPEWIYANTNKIEIMPNETRTFELRTDPKDVAYGEYDIQIYASDSENNTISSNLTLNIPLPNECYQLNITSEKDEINIAKEKTKTTLVSIKNKGLEEGTYLLGLNGEGAKFSMLNPNTLILKPGEAESLYIYTAAPLYSESKDYNLTITATEEKSKVQFSKNFVIKISEKSDDSEMEIHSSKLSNFITRLKELFIKQEQNIKAIAVQNITNQTNSKNLSINLSENLNKEPIANIREELNHVNIGNINAYMAENKSYIMTAGAIILIAFLILTGLWKPIIEFFEEEVVVEEKSKKSDK